MPVLPFLLIPISLFGLNASLWQSIGAALAFGVFCCAAAVFVVSRPGLSGIAMPSFAYAYAPLLLVASISAIYAPYLRAAIFGGGFEFGTVGSIALLAAIVMVATVASDRAVALFLFIFEGIGVAIALFVFGLYIENGSALFLGDTWSQVSLILSAAALVAASLSGRATRGVTQVIHGVFALVALAGFLMLFQAGAALVCSLVAVGVISQYLFSRRSTPLGRFPFVHAMLLFVIALAFSWGLRAPLAEVQPSVRPSFLAFEYIASFEYIDSLQNALIGAGPGSFSYVWNAYRPIEMNASSQSGVVPDTSYSTVTDVALIFGSLGLLALLLYPLLVGGLQFVRRGRSHISLSRARLDYASLTLGTFVYLAMFVYPIDLPLLIVGCMAFGFFSRQLSEEVVYRHIPTLGRISFAFVAACIGVGLVWVTSLQFSAATNHARAHAHTIPDAALVSLLQQAAHTWPIGLYVRDASRGLLAVTFATVNTQQAAGRIDMQALTSAADRISADADISVKIDSKNADTWLASALTYASLTTVGFKGGDDLAKHSFQQAHALAPTRPDIPYLEAQFLFIIGDTEAARTKLEAALALKPDYADALKLLQHLKTSP